MKGIANKTSSRSARIYKRKRSGAPLDRDSWCTPKWLTDALGKWDLDPCGNERSHVQARRLFTLENGYDGLVEAPSIAPERRVFINPPYSNGNVLRWFEAYKHTRFAFLVRLDPSTEWFRRMYRASEAIAMPRKRVNFEPPPGVDGFSNVYPHVLCFARLEDASEQIRRLSFTWRTRPA